LGDLKKYFKFSYVKFSNIAAKVTRRCVNENLRKEAVKRDEQLARVNRWAEGKMVKTAVAK